MKCENESQDIISIKFFIFCVINWTINGFDTSSSISAWIDDLVYFQVNYHNEFGSFYQLKNQYDSLHFVCQIVYFVCGIARLCLF